LVLELKRGLVNEDTGTEVLLGGCFLFAGCLLENVFDLLEVGLAGALVSVDFIL
jgi:hypothetical protein